MAPSVGGEAPSGEAEDGKPLEHVGSGESLERESSAVSEVSSEATLSHSSSSISPHYDPSRDIVIRCAWRGAAVTAAPGRRGASGGGAGAVT